MKNYLLLLSLLFVACKAQLLGHEGSQGIPYRLPKNAFKVTVKDQRDGLKAKAVYELTHEVISDDKQYGITFKPGCFTDDTFNMQFHDVGFTETVGLEGVNQIPKYIKSIANFTLKTTNAVSKAAAAASRSSDDWVSDVEDHVEELQDWANAIDTSAVKNAQVEVDKAKANIESQAKLVEGLEKRLSAISSADKNSDADLKDTVKSLATDLGNALEKLNGFINAERAAQEDLRAKTAAASKNVAKKKAYTDGIKHWRERLALMNRISAAVYGDVARTDTEAELKKQLKALVETESAPVYSLPEDVLEGPVDLKKRELETYRDLLLELSKRLPGNNEGTEILLVPVRSEQEALADAAKRSKSARQSYTAAKRDADQKMTAWTSVWEAREAALKAKKEAIGDVEKRQAAESFRALDRRYQRFKGAYEFADYRLREAKAQRDNSRYHYILIR